MIHLTLQQLSAFLDGELTDASTELIRRHLSECDACTGRFARIESQEEILARVLVDEPGDEFFEELRSSIREAIDPRSRHGKSGAKPSPRTRESGPVKSSGREKAAPAPAALAPAPAPAPAPAKSKPPKKAPETSPAKSAREPAAAADPAISSPDSVPAAGPPPPTAPPAVYADPPERPAVPPPPAVEHEPARASTRVALAARAARSAAAARTAPSRNDNSNIGGYIAVAVILVSVGSTGLVLYKRHASAPPPAPALSQSAPVTPEEYPPSGAPEPEAQSAPVEEAPVEEAPAAVESEPVERLVDRAPRNIVPVRKFITETTVSSWDENDSRTSSLNARDSVLAAQAAARQAEVTRARLVAEAKQSSLLAAQSRNAAALDDAAAAWERALPALEGSPEDLAVARREAARARFQAWAAAPSAARKESAITAARAYLLFAPPGPERDQAWTWLARLKQ